MSDEPSYLFCIGLGYCARHLAVGLIGEGWRVGGTCRSVDRAAALAGQGIEAEVFDWPGEVTRLAGHIAEASHVLVSMPPGAEGDLLAASLADALPAKTAIRWLGYLSTTGVYGDRQGGTVDETSALEPTGPRGQRRVEAEAAWLTLGQWHDIPVHIFRLAGIYGPGRSPLERLREGTARRIVKAGHVFSRIHVDDVAAVLRASMARPNAGAVYNVADDEAAPPDAVIEYAAGLLGMEPPPAIPFEEAELSEMARSFYLDCKRVSNQRIKQELGVRLRYPTYREGLGALAEGSAEPVED